MRILFDLVLDFVVDPIVDLFGFYQGDAELWLMDKVSYLGSLFFAVIAALFFSADIWPLGLLFSLPAVALLLVNFRNQIQGIRNRRNRRSDATDVSEDVKNSESWAENQYRDKAREIQKGLEKQ